MIIASISKTYLEKGDYVAAAAEAAGKLYGYGHGPVLFKPTKATKHPFRATGEEAMSYFVGADNFPGSDKFKGEDGGVRDQRRKGMVQGRVQQPQHRRERRHRGRHGLIRLHLRHHRRHLDR